MRLIIITVLTLAYAEPLLSAERTNEKILEQLSLDLFTAYKAKFVKGTNRPSIYIGEVKNNSQSLSDDDITIIVNKLEAKLSDLVVVLDREKTGTITQEQMLQQGGAVADETVQSLGEKIGASQVLFLDFSDKVTRLKPDLDKVNLTGKLTAIETKTQRKVLTKLATVAYERETFRQSYYFRDTTSFLLYSTAVVTGIGAIGLGIKASSEKKKYDDAKNNDEATKYRKATEQSRTLAGISAGVCLLTWGLGYYVDSKPRDTTEYHEYELSLIPSVDFHLPAMGVAWNF